MDTKKIFLIGLAAYGIFTLGYVCGGMRGYNLASEQLIEALRRQGIYI